MSSAAAEPPSTPPKGAPPNTTAAEDETPAPDSTLPFTRAGALWSALIVGFVILILLLVFIAQNTNSAQFAFLAWHWSLPLGVAILLAAVSGGLIAVAAGTIRIYQLRRTAKKHMQKNAQNR